jgi:hypothetical protein
LVDTRLREIMEEVRQSNLRRLNNIAENVEDFSKSCSTRILEELVDYPRYVAALNQGLIDIPPEVVETTRKAIGSAIKRIEDGRIAFSRNCRCERVVAPETKKLGHAVDEFLSRR